MVMNPTAKSVKNHLKNKSKYSGGCEPWPQFFKVPLLSKIASISRRDDFLILVSSEKALFFAMVILVTGNLFFKKTGFYDQYNPIGR